MDLEQLDSESMDQDIATNDISIHLPSERIKEEHLDQIQPYQLISNSQNENDDENSKTVHEALEITKLTKSAKKRVSLTIEKKIEIIQRHEKGETQKALSQEYQVGRTTVSDILKRKYKFFKFMSMNADKEENLKRRRTLRRTVHKVLEDKLLEWYNDCRGQGDYVSGPMIAAKAQQFHKDLGYTDTFTASNGWLDRFKVRNGIKLCGLREVKTESDVNAVGPFKAEVESLAQWYNLSLDQIYNADEADLFWRMLPNPDSDVNEVKASVRAYRERMTVMCCTNATGQHKLPLVCVGRGKKSRTFTSHEIKQMPGNACYFSQETAWMSHEIFKEWFHNHFVPSVRLHLRSQGFPETALLLIDRSTSHPSDQHLRSEDGFFFCQYFPAKVKSLIQPMEQGILSNMKRHYRRELLTELISKENLISEFQRNLSLKDAIRGVAQGWEQVTEVTIRHCFSKIFPSAIENIHIDSNGLDTSITNEAFQVILDQIPECDGYSTERLEKWLNCDEAEPQKDCNPFKISFEESQIKSEEEKIVFVKMDDDDDEENPETVEIHDTCAIEDQTENASEEEFIEEEILIQSHLLNQTEHHNDPEEITVYEESSEVTCKQAFDALNVLLKFMKNCEDSRYKDVVMLQDLKKKLRLKVESEGRSKGENDEYL